MKSSKKTKKPQVPKGNTKITHFFMKASTSNQAEPVLVAQSSNEMDVDIHIELNQEDSRLSPPPVTERQKRQHLSPAVSPGNKIPITSSWPASKRRQTHISPSYKSKTTGQPKSPKKEASGSKQERNPQLHNQYAVLEELADFDYIASTKTRTTAATDNKRQEYEKNYPALVSSSSSGPISSNKSKIVQSKALNSIKKATAGDSNDGEPQTHKRFEIIDVEQPTKLTASTQNHWIWLEKGLIIPGLPHYRRFISNLIARMDLDLNLGVFTQLTSLVAEFFPKVLTKILNGKKLQFDDGLTLDGYLELLESHSDTTTVGIVVTKFLARFPQEKLTPARQELYKTLYPKIKLQFQLECKPQPKNSWIDFNDVEISSSLRNDVIRVVNLNAMSVPVSEIDATFVTKVGKRLLFDLYRGKRTNFVAQITRDWNHLFPKVAPINNCHKHVVCSGKGFGNKGAINLETWKNDELTARQEKLDHKLDGLMLKAKSNPAFKLNPDIQQLFDLQSKRLPRRIEKLEAWGIVSSSATSSSSAASSSSSTSSSSSSSSSTRTTSADKLSFEETISKGLNVKTQPKDVKHTSAHFGKDKTETTFITRKVNLNPLPIAKRALNLELRKQNYIYNLCVREFNLAITGSHEEVVGVLCGRNWLFVKATDHRRNVLKLYWETGEENENFFKLKNDCFAKDAAGLLKTMRNLVVKLDSSIGKKHAGNLLYSDWTKDTSRDAPVLEFVKAVDISTERHGSHFKMGEKSTAEKTLFTLQYGAFRRICPLFGENMIFLQQGDDKLRPNSESFIPFPDMTSCELKKETVVPDLCKYLREVYQQKALKQLQKKRISRTFLSSLLEHLQHSKPNPKFLDAQLLHIIFELVCQKTERDQVESEENDPLAPSTVTLLLESFLRVFNTAPKEKWLWHVLENLSIFHTQPIQGVHQQDTGSRKYDCNDAEFHHSWLRLSLRPDSDTLRHLEQRSPLLTSLNKKSELKFKVDKLGNWSMIILVEVSRGFKKPTPTVTTGLPNIITCDPGVRTPFTFYDVKTGVTYAAGDGAAKDLEGMLHACDYLQSQASKAKLATSKQMVALLPPAQRLSPINARRPLMSSQMLQEILELKTLLEPLVHLESPELSALQCFYHLSRLENLEILSSLRDSANKVLNKFLPNLWNKDMSTMMSTFHMAQLALNLDGLISKCSDFAVFSKVSTLSGLHVLSDLKDKFLGVTRSGIDKRLPTLDQLRHLSKLSALEDLGSIKSMLQSLLKFVMCCLCDRNSLELESMGVQHPSSESLRPLLQSILQAANGDTTKLNKKQKQSLHSIKGICSDLMKLESLHHLDEVEPMSTMDPSLLDHIKGELLQLSALFRFAGLSRLSKLSELSIDDEKVHKNKKRRVAKAKKAQTQALTHTTTASSFSLPSRNPEKTTSFLSSLSSSSPSSLHKDSPDQDPKCVTRYLNDLHWRTWKRSKTLRRARLRKLRAVRQKVDNFHCHVQSFLLKNYDHVFLPRLRVSELVKHHQPTVDQPFVKRTRFLAKKTVREMLNWRHFEFRRRLEQTSQQNPNFHVHTDCSEEWTSKVCGSCLEINVHLGASKTFKCPNIKCADYGVEVDRDANAASNLARKIVTEWTRK